MRISLAVAAALLIAGCGSNNNSAPTADSTKVKTDSSMAIAPIKSPYPIMYSSSFTMDEPKNAESVLALWKSYDSGDVLSGRNLIADTITLDFSDGTMIRGSRDSISAIVQKERNMYKSVTSSVKAIMAVKSDKGEHWALIWGGEKSVDKKGKEVSMELQEAWQFNNSGQAELMYQYEQKAPKKMGK